MKTFLVTGASAGIGYFVAEQLAAENATVVLGCRDTAKADLAVRAIRTRVPGARLRWVRLDLADLSSLPATVDALGVDCLDAVVLNAGVLLSGPERRVSVQEYELTSATNHLGHFALVAHLAPMLAIRKPVPGFRSTGVSALATPHVSRTTATPPIAAVRYRAPISTNLSLRKRPHVTGIGPAPVHNRTG